MNRINIITSGVANVERSLDFYNRCLALETPNTKEHPNIVFLIRKAQS